MEISIAQQGAWFGVSVGLGVVFAAVFQLSSLLQALLGLRRGTVLLWDLLLFALYGLTAFLYMFVFLDGTIRLYPWMGMALGAAPVLLLTDGWCRKKCRKIRRRQRLHRTRQNKSRFENIRNFLRKKGRNPQKNL